MQEPIAVKSLSKIPFQTTTGGHGRKQIETPKPKKSNAPAKLPHITKLMAMAIRLEHLLATGQVKDQAEIARTAGITRARVTQIINLTQLAPDIQEAILNLEPTTDHVPRSASAKYAQLRSCQTGRSNAYCGIDSSNELRKPTRRKGGTSRIQKIK
jgi:hypothetical protein